MRTRNSSDKNKYQTFEKNLKLQLSNFPFTVSEKKRIRYRETRFSNSIFCEFAYISSLMKFNEFMPRKSELFNANDDQTVKNLDNEKRLHDNDQTKKTRIEKTEFSMIKKQLLEIMNDGRKSTSSQSKNSLAEIKNKTAKKKLKKKSKILTLYKNLQPFNL